MNVYMEKIKEYLKKDWTIGEKTLLISTCLLLGIVVGYLIAPFRSIYCGNNNGSQVNYGNEEKKEKKLEKKKHKR